MNLTNSTHHQKRKAARISVESKCRGEWFVGRVILYFSEAADHLSQLTKEEEDATGEEVEVRREDQDKINKFSRLHQRELVLEEDLSTKNVGSL